MSTEISLLAIFLTGDQHSLDNPAEGKAAAVAEPCPPMARPANACIRCGYTYCGCWR